MERIRREILFSGTLRVEKRRASRGISAFFKLKVKNYRLLGGWRSPMRTRLR